MPTKHPRHAVTETPRLKKVLDRLRDESGSVRLDWGELVLLGAQEKLRRIRSTQEESDRILEEAAELIRRGGGGGDVEAAAEVKRKGLIEL